MSIYRVTLVQVVELEINETAHPDIVTRTQTDDWRRYYYDLTEEQALGMLARCCGLKEWPLSNLDGWGDLPDSAVTARVVFEDVEDSYKIKPPAREEAGQ